MHNYTFNEAIKYEKRNIFRIAYIYLLSKQIIFRTFLQRSPLELFHLRFTLFIFMLSSDLALNALFYFNDNISKKYHYAQNLFLFTFSNNITIIIYSTLLYIELEKILKILKIKAAFLFLIQTILFLFFGYFVTAFCHVYSSTQLSWLLDSFLSILSRIIIELIFAFIYGKLYQISVGSNFECLYKGVMCLYDFS